jgi:hypothetical protein
LIASEHDIKVEVKFGKIPLKVLTDTKSSPNKQVPFDARKSVIH